MYFGRTALLTLALGLFVNGFAQEAGAFGKKPSGPTHLMGNIGDSITAGTLADTDTFLPLSILESLFGEFALDNPKTLVLLENKKSYSWASGEWIDSHYVKLERYLSHAEPKATLNILNAGVPGAVAADTLAQAQQIVDEMKTGTHDELTYVTMLIGANDVCGDGPGGTPNVDFRKSIRATIAKLAEVQQSKPVKVLVSSIPNVPLLARPEIKDHITMGVMSCDFARTNIFGYCKNPLHWQTQDELNQYLQYVQDKDEILRQEVEEAGRTYPGLQLAFGESITNYDISTDILAVDCFHPNKDGQSRMASELWGDQPWFK